ncbi:methyltransferase family protein [Sphaerotilus hippei]|uniref:Methyltransferase family protein n=1 Tax=Sphaerotilus hippei TaxID=744406 RepID=A0A318H358_9BURK|nr:class I SAM-dependent methyltransferase [Sphaerotilus hippei]PXW97976.1 methyltransferase family protein [Sphaerotilus hippei]
MANDRSIIGIDNWLLSASGRYLLAWEQAQIDRIVADIFGFHAIQVGWPALQGLRSSRMGHRWLLCDAEQAGWAVPEGATTLPSVLADFEALPFPAQSLDLVVLPHTLEIARDPHHTLREVERVLRPEGRLVVLGYNPASLMGAGCLARRALARLGPMPALCPLPPQAELIGWRRLRDWLRLLGLEIEAGGHGCHRPPWLSERWLQRTEWLDGAGQRWWPVLGSTYCMVAIKRVRGMRLLGPAWQPRRRPAAQPAMVARHVGPDRRAR